MRACVRSSLIVVLTFGATTPARGEASPETLIVEGRFAEAETLFETQIAADAKDDNARFALGATQTLRAVERLMQGLYRYGLNPRWQSYLPFVRLPVPENPTPEALTNEAFRQLIADFAADLTDVEKTLAPIESPEVKLVLPIGLCRLDFDADGEAEEDEKLWRVLAQATRTPITANAAARFVIAFDNGDVHWLRGYCRLLSALCEMYLAHDTQELHDQAAQFFFPTAKVRYPFTPSKPDETFQSIADAIALVHLLRLEVLEPDRMKTAHGHLLAVIEQSRLSWAAIQAETDDDREWIPNPRQKQPAIPRAAVTEEMVAAWHAVLDEIEAVLQGEKLVPFWRVKPSQGINLKRVFYEPTTFDLVLWIQGNAAAPYFEKGAVTDGNFWWRIRDGFNGQLFWFALWVN